MEFGKLDMGGVARSSMDELDEMTIKILTEFVREKFKEWPKVLDDDDEMFRYYFRMGTVCAVKGLLNNQLDIPGLVRTEDI